MKKVVILTHAPQGTLGDPSSAAKLQEVLLQQAKQKGEEVQIEVLVDVQSCPHQEKVHALFQQRDHKLIDGYESDKGEKQLKDAMSDADFILLYPTPHFMTAKTANLIGATQKPVLSMPEYEHDVAHNQKSKNKFINTVPGTIFISTGFGRDNIGIYIEEEKANKEDLLSRIHSDDRHKFPEDLTPNSGLYFGYFNKLVQTRNGASPANFVTYAAHENPEMKYIDVVMPLMPQPQKNVARQNTIDVLMSPSFRNNLKSCGTVLLCYSHSGSSEQPKYYVYQQEGTEYVAKALSKEEFEAQKSDANKVIRVINPFPINPQSMKALMEASEPVCMLTGNQSFSEGLSLAKIPFYQAVIWHVKLYDSLINATQEFPALNIWFSLLKERDSSPEKVAAFFRENKTKLQEEMELFRQYLLESKDISKNIGGCIDYIERLSLRERFNVFLNHLILNQDFFADCGSIQTRDIWISEYALMKHLEPYLFAASKEEVAQILENIKDNIHKVNPNKEPVDVDKLIISLKYAHPHLELTVSPELALNESFLRTSSWSNSEDEMGLLDTSDLFKALEFINPVDFTLEQKKQFFRNIDSIDVISINDGNTITAQDVLLVLNFLESNTDEEHIKQVLNIIFTKQTNLFDNDVLGPSTKGLFSRLSEAEERIVLNKIESMPMVKQLFIQEMSSNSEIQNKIGSDTEQNVNLSSEETDATFGFDQLDSATIQQEIQDAENEENATPVLFQKQQSMRDVLQNIREQDGPTQTESLNLS
ncbi:hypothetical protein Lgra_2018 [Legionella gratiana]|uniref:Uncharacterized protein n=1 Tax=Legionella gratiana TaxID=45066 RepID=A0A378J9T6_9GAMM|nr:hypothetical protein [Legionella gratiana]KTD11052.1 hypothetical protein Lgra_2018 [Legionella gratiana]STX44604.1 Uncharacterised protein [Legionella gratiana]